jgi:hypothetical protein
LIWIAIRLIARKRFAPKEDGRNGLDGANHPRLALALITCSRPAGPGFIALIVLESPAESAQN